MTSPLVPIEVNLRGLPWMRLDTVRLLDSDLFALSTGDEFKAAVSLWCKSWTQQPAASLPNDDRVLAHLSGAGSKWRKVKEMALRGWELSEDGRLYHPVVAEQALQAWEERQEFRAAVDAANLRKRKEREERAALMADLRAANIHLVWNAPIGEVRSRHAELSPPVTHEGRDLSSTCHGDSHGLEGTGRDGTGLLEAKAKDAPADAGVPGTGSAGTENGGDTGSDLLGDQAPGTAKRMPDCPHAAIVDAWGEVLPELQGVASWSDKRRTHLAARWKADRKRQTVDWWRELFRYARGSRFLMGEKTDFAMTLPWLVQSEENLLKVVEGNYHDAA